MPQNSYLLASVAVGVAQIADAVLLTQRFDKRIWGAVTILFSFGECVWAGVSLLIWRNQTESIPPWLPASFVAYVAMFFAAGLVLAIRSKGERTELPKKVAVAGGWFGGYFALASLFHWGNA